jgi:uncharacterized protein
MLPQDTVRDKDSPPSLLVDAMLGRLAHWLRLMGYDTAYWRDGTDADLIREARAEGRLIITRDHQLAGRRGIHSVLILSESLGEQIAEARAALEICSPVMPRPFTRCPECNGELHDLSHDLARDLVPPYVWQTQHVFRRCPDCGRVYWKGTHWPSMQSRLEGEK